MTHFGNLLLLAGFWLWNLKRGIRQLVLSRQNKLLAGVQRCNKSTIWLVYLIFSFIFISYDVKPMISLHIPYLEKTTNQNVRFISQHGKNVDPYFAGKIWQILLKCIKNRFHYERNPVSAYIFKVWVCWNIVIDSSSTRVDSSVIHETRVGTLTTRGSTKGNLFHSGLYWTLCLRPRCEFHCGTCWRQN